MEFKKKRDWPWSVFVAGFQFSALIIGRHIWPFSSTFGWYIFVLKFILGGLKGYSAGKLISMRNAPLLYGGLSYGGKRTSHCSDFSLIHYYIVCTKTHNIFML